MLLTTPSFIVWLVFGAVSAYMAVKRGKNPFLWFFLGMVFGIFGLMFLYFNPQRKPQKQETDPTTIDVTPQFDPAHKNVLWYYLDPDNRQNGPMSFDLLVRLWKEGKVTNTTYVWNENLDLWKPFGDFT